MTIKPTNKLTRRDFGKMALAGVPAAATALSARNLIAQATKPNSRIRGVQIGMITSGYGLSGPDFIAAVQKIGFSELELQNTYVETLAGAPARGNGGRGQTDQLVTLNAAGLTPRCANMAMVIDLPPSAILYAKGKPTLSPEQEAAQKKLWDWRNSTTEDTWKGVRKQFTDAGIEVRIMFYAIGYRGAYISDEEIDYAFRMAKGLGVRAMSSGSTIPIAKRVAPVAEKYKVLWGGHTSENIHDPDQFATPEVYEQLLSLSPYVRINLDLG